MHSRILIELLLILFFATLFNGCSGKQIYKTAIKYNRYKANLELKKIAISDDLNVSYLENSIPSKKTVVLIHGFGANKDNWLYLAQEFDEKYHLLIPDLIGSGGSTKPMDINYTVEKQTELLHLFLKKFDLNDTTLIANSMGGAIALTYATKYPIDSLILIDAMGIKVEDSYMDKLGVDKIKKTWFDICSVEQMRVLISQGSNKPPYIPESVLEYLTEGKCRLAKLERHKYYGILDKNLDVIVDLRALAQQIEIPTLIIWGKEDKLLSYKNAYAFQANIKGSKLLILDGIGHVPMIEDAPTVSRSILEFLHTTQ